MGLVTRLDWNRTNNSLDIEFDPIDRARVCTTAIVCGWQSSATKKTFFAGSATTARHIAIASAAAVASSSSDEFASGSAVRSATIVWKLSSASSRPCAISAW